jgi:hypothetical protein
MSRTSVISLSDEIQKFIGPQRFDGNADVVSGNCLDHDRSRFTGQNDSGNFASKRSTEGHNTLDTIHFARKVVIAHDYVGAICLIGDKRQGLVAGRGRDRTYSRRPQ